MAAATVLAGRFNNGVAGSAAFSAREILGAGGVAKIDPVDAFEIRQGDLISITIGARDNNHSCDLTEIDLTIVETEDQKRSWSYGDGLRLIHAGRQPPP